MGLRRRTDLLRDQPARHLRGRQRLTPPAPSVDDRPVAMRIGLDLVSVAGVTKALRGPLGDRYLERVYTDGEVADCRTSAGVDPRRLAARFAAKEATVKVLETSAAIPLREIEVWLEPSGRARVALRGRAARLAAEAGLSELAVSLTCDGELAAAVVAADRP